MDSIWTPVSDSESIWTPNPDLESIWTPFSDLDSKWTPNGLQMDFEWTMIGLRIFVYCVASDHLLFKTHVVIQFILVASEVCVIVRVSCCVFVVLFCLLVDACADVHGNDMRSADS